MLADQRGATADGTVVIQLTRRLHLACQERGMGRALLISPIELPETKGNQ
jgi:hypothetical protein